MSQGWAYILLLAAFLAAAVFSSCHKDGDSVTIEETEQYPGGATTVFDTTEYAFNNPAPNLSAERSRAFFTGNSFFRQNWVLAPSSTSGRDGLGPLFNARSCGGCHQLDGRGRPPLPGEAFESLLLRLSIPGADGPLADPNYGLQLNQFAISGVAPEGAPTVIYEEIAGAFPDGETYSLRRPTYAVNQLAYGSFAGQIQMSPRVAPVMIGLGLLSVIDEAAILANTDPADANKDGVSGRANYVWNMEAKRKTLGRFGWKANQPTLKQQVAGAFLGDIGITSSLFPDENCTAVEVDCANALSGGKPEISDTLLDRVVFYSHFLAVPARRLLNSETMQRGKQLFTQIGCAKCHQPKWRTGLSAEYPELSNQTIWPYTDLLLHDMGEDLADHRPDFDATGTEWRTPPLWGIGLIPKVNGHSYLLHDGRARNIREAILWHGGEGQPARDAFKQLSAKDRATLEAYIRSL